MNNNSRELKEKICIHVACGSNPRLRKGGTSSFILNIDSFLCEQYQIKYVYIPEFLEKFRFLPLRIFNFIYTYIYFLNANKINIVLSHSPESSFVFAFTNIPLIHIFHGNNNPVKNSKHWYARYFQFLFKYIDSKIMAHAIALYSVGEAKPNIKKLYTPILPIQDEYYPQEMRKNIVFLGRLEPVKNVFRVIDIYAKIPEKIKNYHELTIIGDGSLKAKLIKYARKKYPNDKIRFLGFMPHDQAVYILSRSILLLLISKHEGFPMVIGESLSCGTPVISSNVGSINNVIKNYINGFCLDLNETDEKFVCAIEEIYDNYIPFSKNARKSSIVFDPKSVANELIKGIESILEK